MHIYTYMYIYIYLCVMIIVCAFVRVYVCVCVTVCVCVCMNIYIGLFCRTLFNISRSRSLEATHIFASHVAIHTFLCICVYILTHLYAECLCVCVCLWVFVFVCVAVLSVPGSRDTQRREIHRKSGVVKRHRCIHGYLSRVRHFACFFIHTCTLILWAPQIERAAKSKKREPKRRVGASFLYSFFA